MKHIDPATDQLMWLVAEKGETKAVEEFEERYPDHKYELAHRIAMLRGLRQAGRDVHRTAPVPVFTPSFQTRPATPRRVLFAVGTLGLAAIAMATYTVTTLMQPAPTNVHPTPKVSVRPAPVPTPAPTVVETHAPPPPETVIPRPEVVPATPRYLKPQDVKIDHAPLTSAIQMICAQGGLEVTLAPGMPDQDIKVQYTGVNTIDILKDLGRQYGFTAFDQGDGTVIVIPAVDKKTMPVHSLPTDTGARGPADEDSDAVDATTLNRKDHTKQ